MVQKKRQAECLIICIKSTKTSRSIPYSDIEQGRLKRGDPRPVDHGTAKNEDATTETRILSGNLHPE